jgi:multidrug efflux pump subunit AcrB
VTLDHNRHYKDRLQSIGLTSGDVAQQLQFLLSGIPITDVREDVRSVQVSARSAGNARLDPSRIADFTLVGAAGQRIPLSQIGTVQIRMEDPILRRRDRTPTITVRGDIAEGLQPPDVLSGILMRNTLILIGQIRSNEKDGFAPFAAVVEATVQRSRPVILTALAAMLAFIPLTHSVFWGTLAYTLIGGTFGGTVLTLVFLPALYAIWFKIKPVEKGRHAVAETRTEPVPA